MSKFLSSVIVACGFLVAHIATAADPAALFVFDGSGSMWGQVDGTPKIELAKTAMSRLIKDFPAGTDIGLIAYGHRREGDCGDIETLAPVGSNKDTIIQAVQSINPKGKTPLTKSIEFAAEQLKGRDAPTSIVVISDGKESCNADPCAAAKAVREAGTDLSVHVIGFNVKADEAKQLECIAENGGGKYFAANNAADLSASFAEVKKEVAVVAKPKPASKVIFRDDFNGDVLSDQWELLNPDEESFIVEDGHALFLTGYTDSPTFGTIPNILRLNRPIPKGDWQTTAKFSFTPQTLAESINLELANADGTTSYVSRLNMYSDNYARTLMSVAGYKFGKKKTGTYKTFLKVSDRDQAQRAKAFGNRAKAVFLRTEKKGRLYTTSTKFEVVDPEEKDIPQDWVVVSEVKSLRPPGDKFDISFYSTFPSHWDYTSKDTQGEIQLDWFELRSAD